MVPKSDFPDIDWANEDVSRIVEIFSEKFDVMMQKKDEVIDKLAEENKQIVEENKRLRQEIERLKSTGGRRSRKSRSYNAREFKGYPRPENYSKRRRPADAGSNAGAYTIQKTARLEYCPGCGGRLPESGATYGRTTEDAINGRWTKTEWNVARRYCKKCARQYSAVPDGVLPGGHFGVNIMSQVCCMRCLAIPHEKIAKIIHMLYGRFIEVSNIMHMCDTAAGRLRPLYEGLQGRLADAHVINGDDTGWYYNGLHWHAWVFLTADMVPFHLSSSRSKNVAEAMLEGFEGVTMGDSHSSWNDVGTKKQRCLPRYFRDMYLTLKKNEGPEFRSFFKKLHRILKSAINAFVTYGERNERAPERTVRSLQRRIDRLAAGSYEDRDCKRYAKRLKRERDQLLTFLTCDGVPYHNNASERAPRVFALMRKVCYGSRSMRGIETTEIITTVYSTCELRGVNPYTFMADYLGGRTKSIPMPEKEHACAVAAA